MWRIVMPLSRRRTLFRRLLILQMLCPVFSLFFFINCHGFTPQEKEDAAITDVHALPDSRSALDKSVEPPDKGRVDAETESCPSNIVPPTITSFTITDGISAIPLETSVSFSVIASGEKPLRYSYTVSPFGDPVSNYHDGTGQWKLSQAPKVFFSTRFTITVTVMYSCQDGPSSQASVQVKVLGNVLVADYKHATIEALGSNGKHLGQIAGPAVLSGPTDMLLLSSNELAVADLSAHRVKVLDLQNGTLIRNFADNVPDLSPQYLDRTLDGDLLVGFSKNQFFRYSPKGVLQKTITAPHPYGCAGLTHLSDGSIIVGTSGSGRQYRFSSDGTSLGLFADPASTADTNSLLALPNDDFLLGGRDFMNDGRLIRLDKQGVVQQTIQPAKLTFYYLRAFKDGYLFHKFFDNVIYFISKQLVVQSTPFSSLSSDMVLQGMVWLDNPPL